MTTRINAAITTSSSAIASAVNIEKEALSILNTVQNFQTVSQQAAVDAANALKKVRFFFLSLFVVSIKNSLDT